MSLGGRVEIESGTVLLYGDHATRDLDVRVAAGARLDLTSGTSRTYSGTLRARGDGAVTLGGGTLLVDSGLTLEGDGATLAWDTGTVQGTTPTAELVNRGTWNLVTDGPKMLRGVSLRNEGTLRKTDAGTASLDAPVTNLGDVVVESGTLDVGPAYRQESGRTRLAGGDLAAQGPIEIDAGRLEGSGAVAATVENGGEIHPGGDGQIGRLAIAALHQRRATAAIHVEIGAGSAPGVDFDQVAVGGAATLQGLLDVHPLAGHEPPAGVPFPAVTWAASEGSFDAVTCVGYVCTPAYDATGVTITFP